MRTCAGYRRRTVRRDADFLSLLACGEDEAMKGKCLCGEVEFEVVGKLSNLYQCHCSLCQKATGSSCVSSLVTSGDGVKWIRGKEKVSSYTKDNGYRTDFCSICGSPVPNKMSIGDYMWIPAGLLEGPVDMQIVAHIYTASGASWDRDSENCETFSEGPVNLDEFIDLLQRGG